MSEINRSIPKFKLLLFFPVVFCVLMILYWVVYDLIIKSVPIFYLDIYGRGFLTWWLDSETFWGNFLLSTMKALILSGFFIIYSPNPNQNLSQSNEPQKSTSSNIIYWSFGLLLSILVIMIVFSRYSPGSGAHLDLASILFGGWYQDYFCSRIIELILFLLNIYFIFTLMAAIKKNFQPAAPNNTAMIYFAIAWFLGVYLAWKSEWSLWGLFNMNFIFDYVASLLFIFPLATYLVIQYESKVASNLNDGAKNKALKLHLIVRLALMVIVYGILIYAINYYDNQMLLQIELKIRLETSWFFRNLLSWLYIVFLTTLFYIFGKRNMEVKK